MSKSPESTRPQTVLVKVSEDPADQFRRFFVVAVKDKDFEGDLPWSFGEFGEKRDSGLDLPLPKQVTIKPQALVRIPLGIYVRALKYPRWGTEPPVAHPVAFDIRPRSSIARPPKATADDSQKARGRTLLIPNSPATIDIDYRGELMFQLFNPTALPVTLNANEAVAQVTFPGLELFAHTVISASSPEYEHYFPETQRGAGGFGSTGLSGTRSAT